MNEYSLEEINRRARSGPLLMLFRRLCAAVFSFAGTITIARLLTPRDYGLAAMSIVIVSFMQMFRDLGLSNALMRKGRIEPVEMDFLFWFNAGATIMVAGALALASPLVADFYHEPVVAKIVLVSLVGFVIEGLCLQHSGLLKRDLRFSAVAAAEIASVVVGFAVGLALALVWRNVWAIVFMGLAQSLTISLVTVRVAHWRPGPPRKPPHLRELLGFGANVSAFSFLNFLSRNSGTFVIGHLIGSTPLGLFNRAFTLFQLPVNNLLQPLTVATLPVMARLRREPEQYARVYLSLVRALCCALVPTGAILLSAASPLVEALLGERWAEAGPVLAILSSSLILYGVVWPTSDLLISQNRSGDLRMSGVYDCLLRVGGALIGSRFGIVGVATGLTIGLALTVPIRVWQSGRNGPVSCAAQFGAFTPSVPLGIGAGLGAWGARSLGEHLLYGSGGLALGCFIGGAMGSLLAILIFNSTREAVFELLSSMTGRQTLGLSKRTAPISPDFY